MEPRYIEVFKNGQWKKVGITCEIRGKLTYWNGIEYITKIGRVRPGNGYYGSTAGKTFQDLYLEPIYNNPNSPAQQTQRSKFAAAMTAWKNLTAGQKETWALIGKPLGFCFGRTYFMHKTMLI